jgi:hypothetical protein
VVKVPPNFIISPLVALNLKEHSAFDHGHFLCQKRLGTIIWHTRHWPPSQEFISLQRDQWPTHHSGNTLNTLASKAEVTGTSTGFTNHLHIKADIRGQFEGEWPTFPKDRQSGPCRVGEFTWLVTLARSLALVLSALG